MIERNENSDKTKKQKFSYSKLNQYENCPYAYNLKYNEGHFYNVPSLAASFGTLVHKIEENISHLIMNGRPVNYEMLRKDFWNMNVPKRNKYDRDGDIFGANFLASSVMPSKPGSRTDDTRMSLSRLTESPGSLAR